MKPNPVLLWRKRQGWTQREAALKLAMSLAAYQHIERGNVLGLSVTFMVALKGLRTRTNVAELDRRYRLWRLDQQGGTR